MASQPVQPLRIHKASAHTSPVKMNRPLAELSPMGIRRNSPSFPQSNKNNSNGDLSPYDSATKSASSPRLFWQGRDPTSPNRSSIENRSPFDLEHSPVPSKRSSIENLKKASRVKNSSMFAREQKSDYDPNHVTVPDRPLATGRPLGMQVQGNAFSGQGLEGMRKENAQKMAEESTESVMIEPVEKMSPPTEVAPLSPSKYNASPAKSSLSKKTGMNAREMGFDPEKGMWSEDEDSVIEKKLPEGRVLHRHAKSVTFDQAPPQINEYEMTTPDPSSVASGSREGSYESVEDEEDASFERGFSFDREDSFDASLEDTERTPVVLPEDWRFMSPEVANTALVREEDDTFDGEYGSPEPGAEPGSIDRRPHQTSLNSVDSNGHARPLPPLPNMNNTVPASHFSVTLERISSGQRFLPSPPQAAGVSKSDIRRMSGSSLPLEDRLRLMMLQEQDREQNDAESQRERRMRRAELKEDSSLRHDVLQIAEIEATTDKKQESTGHGEETRISRDHILRRLSSQQDLHDDTFEESALSFSSNLPNYANADPDIPIPSRDDPTQVRLGAVADERAVIKEEPADEFSLYSIPYAQNATSRAESEADDTESQYSQASAVMIPSLTNGEGQNTPRAQSPARESEIKKTNEMERPSLPLLADFGTNCSFDFGLESYMTPSPPLDELPKQAAEPLQVTPFAEEIRRPATPQEQLQPMPMSCLENETASDPGTPDSVIRHPVTQSLSPEIAEPIATVKAPGSNLKTRPSITPADASSMAAARRQVSGQIAPPPAHDNGAGLTDAERQPAPSIAIETRKRVSSLVQLDIPQSHSEESLGFGLEKEFDRVLEAQKVAFELSLSRLHHAFHGRFPSSEHALPSKSQKLKDIPPLKPQGSRALPGDQRAWGHQYPTDGSHFADRSSDRQRGYLMRQNTKVVVASNRVEEEPKPAPAKEAVPPEPAPRKASQQTWVTEPWNGKTRRRSIRTAGELSPRKKGPGGPVPPLPGQASAVQDGLGAVHEDEIAEEEAQDFDENAERGRLFVKVVGVKDLDLPLPREEQSFFALTLDNGLHCVTTSWLPLGMSAPIGQEFELVVLNELEFQLTLQMKLEPPKPKPIESPVKPPPSPVKKQGTFSRLFGSPKKKIEAQIVRPISPVKPPPPPPPSAYELVQGIVGQDGSFARAYVALNEHEKHAFGRPHTVDITCFNEWAMEEVAVGSSRSKKNVTAMQRRPPYQIGKIELQLLYIPKPKGARDEDMPKSMNSAIRELRDAETRTSHVFEGHLSQQGGDCPYWRRRLFKLAGSKLTAYHETTHQPRATINLAKASKLIDDKSALTKKETSTKGGGRRKSAFAEEEEGYMFVEEGFRIRFANGEVIDFYADSAADKGAWMKVLSEVVGKPAASSLSKPWVEMILKRERSLAAKEGRAPRTVRPEISPQKTGTEQMQEEMAHRAAMRQRERKAAAAAEEQGLRTAAGDRSFGEKRTSIPLSAPNPSPEKGSRYSHARPESYQPVGGSRSQPGSPVKGKNSRDARHQKARSMIGMQWH